MAQGHTVPFSPTMIYLHDLRVVVPVNDIYTMIPGEFVPGLDPSLRAQSIKITLKSMNRSKYSFAESLNIYNDRAERDAVLLMYTGIF